MAKKEVTVKSDAFSNSAHKGKGTTNFFQGKGEVVEVEKRVKPAYVVSRLDHPITLSYSGETIIIPPRGREVVANYELLGAIPKGISIVPKF